jgi:hypothetical protein
MYELSKIRLGLFNAALPFQNLFCFTVEYSLFLFIFSPHTHCTYLPIYYFKINQAEELQIILKTKNTVEYNKIRFFFEPGSLFSSGNMSL